MDTEDQERFMNLITNRTTLSSGVVKNVQKSEVETLIGLLLEGRPVHTGVAIFTPSIEMDGDININVKVDKRILAALNTPGAFTGSITNSENVGKTGDDLVAQWNEDSPGRPNNLREIKPSLTATLRDGFMIEFRMSYDQVRT